VAAWAAPIVGTLLVPRRQGDRGLRTCLLEANLRGVRPLVPIEWLPGAPPANAALIVSDEATAARAGAPVAGVWSRSAPPEPSGSVRRL
jgi:hypothetical protein